MADPVLGLNGLGGTDTVAHVIQVALTPVFLLSGIGTLLGMFNLRQNRVADHLEHLTDLADQEEDARRDALLVHLHRLRRRRTMLDASLVLGAVGAACTCSAAFVLFLGSVREASIAIWLDVLFGAALACTIGALIAFLSDTILAWHGLRTEGAMPRSRPS